jgi:UDP-arabinose 4-epimerase
LSLESLNAVLVTGGAGYIGSHVCKQLSKKGYLPVSLDNMINGYLWAVKWGPLEIGDIADQNLLIKLIKKYKPIAVMHFAAFAYVGESMSDPSKYYNNNVAKAISLIDVCRENAINHFVFSSSCATYGIPDVFPIDEKQAQKPINPYGESKLFIEKLLRDYDKAYGFKSVVLRYFNAAGADADGEIGEFHIPETHLIPLILDVAQGKRNEINVYGSDYNTDDGSCIRDYIHVTDLADAHVKALQYLIDGNCSVQMNLGTGKGYSVMKVIEKVQHITGKHIKFSVEDRRLGDPAKLVADAGRARKILNWNPKYSSLGNIISSAWKWHQIREELND